MKRNYWSCSKFADWLRGIPKTPAGTAEEWNAWQKAAKAKKVRYWLAEEGLDYLQDFIYSPLNFINNIRHYFNNRWISKTHALTSNLQRGKYYDLDTRLLHAIFDELTNFVELEAGLAYLEWASTLKYDQDDTDKDDPKIGQPTMQALSAQKTIMLYKWWKEIRPNRPDPMIASGWSDYCEKRRQISGDETSWTGSYDENTHAIMESYRKMEQAQDDEDTEMLIHLVKLRSYLWT